MRIALIGTRGVPARYGGFETAAEEIGARLVQRGCDVVVYCRERRGGSGHLGMRRVYVPHLRRRALETLSHSFLSIIHAAVVERPDAAIVFNAANGPLVPLLKTAGIPAAIHVDGLEWKRAKWAGFGARYYRWAEATSVRRANAIIADAQGIRDYLSETYRREAVLLTYGSKRVDPVSGALVSLGLVPGAFHLVVARFEPENHVWEIVDGYRRSHAQLPLVLVGHEHYTTDYSRSVAAAAQGDPRIRFLGPIWDQDLLDQLYAGATTYFHGHSVGGTNPSLLRAMGAAAPVVAFNVNFNREVTGGDAEFFDSPDCITRLLPELEREPTRHKERAREARDRALRTYSWDRVTDGYLELCTRLAASSSWGKL